MDFGFRLPLGGCRKSGRKWDRFSLSAVSGQPKADSAVRIEYNDLRRQPDRTAASRVFGREERKVRTPQSSVPDNVRDAGFKLGGRKVPQKTYRLGGNAGVRVKRCGKSAPPRQECRGQGKPHTEQDQIG